MILILAVVFLVLLFTLSSSNREANEIVRMYRETTSTRGAQRSLQLHTAFIQSITIEEHEFEDNIRGDDSIPQEHPEGLDTIDHREDEVPFILHTQHRDGIAITSYFYHQDWDPWGSVPYGTHAGASTYSRAGCGPTSVAMIARSLGVVNATPLEAGAFMTPKWRNANNGTFRAGFEPYFTSHGLRSQWVPRTNLDCAKEALRNGGYIVVGAGRNSSAELYNGRGHFLVISGISSCENFVTVLDPKNYRRGINGSQRDGAPSGFWTWNSIQVATRQEDVGDMQWLLVYGNTFNITTAEVPGDPDE
jgi:hypothetical protein